MRLGSIAAFAAIGLGAGVAATRHAHRAPASRWPPGSQILCRAHGVSRRAILVRVSLTLGSEAAS
jgi:hypothetical protein